jgi:2EXR family
MDNQHMLEGDRESPNIPSPADKFTLFPKLPAEMRLKVWKFALPGTYRGMGALFFPFRNVSRRATPLKTISLYFLFRHRLSRPFWRETNPNSSRKK